MGTIEEIQRYIERTVKPDGVSSYQMTLKEAFALACIPDETGVTAIFLAFKYGQAKGCRAARANARKRKEKVT